MIDGLHHLALDPCAVTQRHHHQLAGGIKLLKLFLADKALYHNSLFLPKGLNLPGHLRPDHIEPYARNPFPDGREYLPCKPQDRIRVGRMGKASHKQKPFPLGKVILYVGQERVIDICGNGLCMDASVNGMDCIYLHIGRIIGNSRLMHHGQFH